MASASTHLSVLTSLLPSPSTTTMPRASSTCTGMGRGGPTSLPWSSQLTGIRRQERSKEGKEKKEKHKTKTAQQVNTGSPVTVH